MRAVRTIAAVAVAIAGAAALHSSVGAYSTYARWASSPVTFYVNPVNADVSQTAAAAALQFGMDVWNTQSGTSFRYQYGGTVTDTATAHDNRNVIFFRNATNGSAIATTYSWWSSSNELLDSDIIFWDGGFTFFTGTSGCGVVSNAAYIEDVAAHELGHALGLNHSSSTDATMYPSYSYCSQALRTLASDDINGAKALYPTVSNTAPSVTISSPANNASYASGASVSFSGSASDTQDGSLTSALAWTSSIDGAIGLGGSFTRVLSAGTHTIKATAVDSGGLTTVKQVTVTVASASSTNTAPSVTISSPANGASYASGTAVSFSGSASDTQDGSLTASLVWTSNIDGTIGSGGAFTKVLTAGSHTIKATVTDKGGLTTVAQVSVTVGSSGGTLTAKGRKTKGAQAVDLTWNGVSGTSLDVYRNSTKWSTANDGAETDSIGKKGSATYTYKVCTIGTTTCSNTATVVF